METLRSSLEETELDDKHDSWISSTFIRLDTRDDLFEEKDCEEEEEEDESDMIRLTTKTR